MVIAQGAGPVIRLELAAYEAAVLVLGDDLPNEAGARVNTDDASAATGTARDVKTAPLSSADASAWTVSFAGQEPASVALPHDWTAERPHFAGTAVYEHVFNGSDVWGESVPSRVELDFGEAVPVKAGDAAERGMRGASYRAMVEAPIREVATVTVNGVDCGTLYAPPYLVDVTHAVRQGDNVLRIAVGNATAAALAAPEAVRRLDADVAATHERYGMRFRMQDVEHAADGLRSGLLTVPALRWTA
jgi:hypothetical protein